MNQANFKEGKFYHLFNRGNNKQDIFFEEKNYLYFLNLVKKHLLPIVNVYAYCLLKNHFHFIIQIKDEELPKSFKNAEGSLHQPFSNLFNAYTKAINKMYNRTGSLFQEHLKRKEIKTDDYLKNLILYIHLNPLSHEVFENFENYPHSSYKAMILTKPTLLKREEVIALFEDVENFRYVHSTKKVNDELLEEVIIDDY